MSEMEKLLLLAADIQKMVHPDDELSRTLSASVPKTEHTIEMTEQELDLVTAAGISGSPNWNPEEEIKK